MDIGDMNQNNYTLIIMADLNTSAKKIHESQGLLLSNQYNYL